MAELSQDELQAALRSIYEAEGLIDMDVLIAINDEVLIELAKAAQEAAAEAAPAAGLAAAPENMPVS